MAAGGRKAGHTGTLDPLASGLLPVCLGAATKFAQVQLEADKAYEAVLRLGVRTTTGDAEGEVIATAPVDAARLTPSRLAELARRFTGVIEQIPPMHSALKKDGKALYEYARAGIEVERAPRTLTIHALTLEPMPDDPAALRLRVRCSKGTYVRTLAEDIGAALGCGAPDRAAACRHRGADAAAGDHAGRAGNPVPTATPALPAAPRDLAGGRAARRAG